MKQPFYSLYSFDFLSLPSFGAFSKKEQPYKWYCPQKFSILFYVLRQSLFHFVNVVLSIEYASTKLMSTFLTIHQRTEYFAMNHDWMFRKMGFYICIQNAYSLLSSNFSTACQRTHVVECLEFFIRCTLSLRERTDLLVLHR